MKLIDFNYANITILQPLGIIDLLASIIWGVAHMDSNLGHSRNIYPQLFKCFPTKF